MARRKRTDVHRYLLDKELVVLRIVPDVIALGTFVSEIAVATHDALQDGREWRDADARSDQHGVLGFEDVLRWGSIRAVD